MLSKKQCEIARELTGDERSDEDINRQFDCLSSEEKEEIGKEIYDIIQDRGDSFSMLDLQEMSAVRFTSLAPLLCVFKDWQVKQGMIK